MEHLLPVTATAGGLRQVTAGDHHLAVSLKRRVAQSQGRGIIFCDSVLQDIFYVCSNLEILECKKKFKKLTHL